MSASTYTFMMMWEYSHYLLFVQAVSLFLLDSFALAQTEKVLELFSVLIIGDLNTASEVPAVNNAQELQRVQTEWWLEHLAAWVQLKCMSCPSEEKNELKLTVFWTTVFGTAFLTKGSEARQSCWDLKHPWRASWKSDEWYSVMHPFWPSCLLFSFPYSQ